MQKNLQILLEEVMSKIQIIDDEWDTVDRAKKLFTIISISMLKAQLDYKRHKAEYKYLKAIRKKHGVNLAEDYLSILDAVISETLEDCKTKLKNSKALYKDTARSLRVYKILFKHYKKGE